MKKILYTRPDGGVSIVVPTPKKDLERVLGSLTDIEYEDHVRQRSIPIDAINVRDIDDSDLPSDREFRNAWVDVTPESTIDLDCTKAKDIQLGKLRRERDAELEKLDKEFMIALERADNDKIAAIKLKKQNLRDATNPLKALDTNGKINDTVTLDRIRTLGSL